MTMDMKRIFQQGVIACLIFSLIFTVTVVAGPGAYDAGEKIYLDAAPAGARDGRVQYDPVVAAMLQTINESMVTGYIQTLEGFGPRVTGSTACHNAGTYIYTQFQAMNLSVSYHNWASGGYSDRNIVAELQGTNTSSDRVYVICAHYDSVSGSPGADDDGSGTAAVLAAAETMSTYQFEHTVRFVAFSGEEQGLLGSSRYASYAAAQGDNIAGALNADMIGYTETPQGGTNVKIYENTASQWMTDLAVNVSSTYPEVGLTVHRLSGSANSDHYSFWSNGYDAIFYHEYEFNNYYHSPQDTMANMNLSYDAVVTRFMTGTLVELAALDVQREHDVGVVSIDHPQDNQSLPAGVISINATLANHGTVNQSNVTVTCSVDEVLSPAVTSPVYSDDMESDDGNWTATGDHLLWEWGIPSVGPPAAHSGSRCRGTNLDGSYGQDNTDEYLSLTSMLIPACDAATISFYTWYDIENGYDGGVVEVNNGSGWTQLDPGNDAGQYDRTLNTGYGNSIEGQFAFTGTSNGWEKKTFDLSPFIGQMVQLRFHFATDSGVHGDPGWYIDDVSLLARDDEVTQCVYANQATVSSLASNATMPVHWTYLFANTSRYYVSVSTALTGDQRPWNDMQTIAVTITGGGCTISLAAGWNLMTVPVANDYNASSLGADIPGCDIVAYWNASAGMFQSYVVGITPGSGFAIEDGVGYFVYVNTSDTFSVTGAPLSSVAVDLFTGWNTIGWYDADATNASSLAPSVPYCSIAAYWNATSSTFESYTVGVTPPPGFAVSRGMGVFVYVTAPGVWTGQG